MQIKIGDVIARSADDTVSKKNNKKKNVQPKIAFVEDGNIYIEDLLFVLFPPIVPGNFYQYR